MQFAPPQPIIYLCRIYLRKTLSYSSHFCVGFVLCFLELHTPRSTRQIMTGVRTSHPPCAIWPLTTESQPWSLPLLHYCICIIQVFSPPCAYHLLDSQITHPSNQSTPQLSLMRTESRSLNVHPNVCVRACTYLNADPQPDFTPGGVMLSPSET